MRYNRPMKQAARRFIFESITFPSECEVAFQYRVELTENPAQHYVESLTFPEDIAVFLNSTSAVSFLQSLHLMLGVSYWKAHCAPEIAIEAGYSLSQTQADFWNTMYTKGLGEFFYVNQINFRGLVQFPVAEKGMELIQLTTDHNKALVPFGGGKDSIVTAEQLKVSRPNFELIAINPQPLQFKVAEKIGKPLISILRKVDATLLAQSKEKSVYVGHVPMTAIYTFVALAVAAAKGYGQVMMSNEQSANEGNVEYLGEMINHQWSKSEECELLMTTYIAMSMSPSISVFSLLRGMTELQIIEAFTHYPQYFHDFSSCNKNFALAGSKNTNGSLWCGECPKCAFVFAGLAAYLPKETVISIFGKNMFANESLVVLYKQLLGFQDFKPFECVGTSKEAREAFTLIAKRGECHNDVVMNMVKEKGLV